MSGYIEPTPENAKAVFSRGLKGPVVMLNLLRFRDVADYSASPELAPPEPISGADAYRRYMAHTAPFVAEVGGEVLFLGDGGAALIGPSDERWDLVLLVKQNDIETFFKFANNAAYLKGLGHRTAALADSRLVPMTPRAIG